MIEDSIKKTRRERDRSQYSGCATGDRHRIDQGA